jgi:glycosyltransferase involved in cell wall biosynthesis
MLVDIINQQVVSNHVLLIILNDQINTRLLNHIDKKVKIIKINRHEKSRNPIPIIRLNWQLLLENPDVIHCHHNNSARVLVYKKNIVLTVHDNGLPVDCLNKYRTVFAISKSVKKDIESRCGLKAILVYNGITISQIQKKENYCFDVFRIVMVSRLVHEKKGQHILIEALRILIKEKKFSNISIDFIGEGPSLIYLQQLVKKFDIDGNVIFLGNLDRTNIYDHLKDYDLLVQPSLFEGFGLTIVEAMTAKVPVLVSDIEGPMEVIDNGKFGWSFKTGDASDCAEKLQRIMNDYHACITVVNRAYERAITEFDIKKTSDTYLKHY